MLAGTTAAQHHVRCQSKRVRVQNGAQRGSWFVVVTLLTNPNYSLPHLPQNELVHVVVDSVRCLGACTWQRDYKLIRTKFTIELNLFARPAGAGGGCGLPACRSGFINNHYSYKWLTRVTILQHLCGSLWTAYAACASPCLVMINE